MTLTLHPTPQIITHEGTQCRIWKGESDTGCPVVAAIAFVGGAEGHDHTAFEKELSEIPQPDCAKELPKPAARGIDLRHIL